MVRDGYFYGLAALIVAALIGYFTIPVLALIPLLLGAFFVWFFRDPERRIPDARGAIVSPADGKVTSAGRVLVDGQMMHRISIFLNVFNVHVNRSPVGGRISRVEYRKGKFMNAMGDDTSDQNEQNIVTVEGDGQVVVFKQIAGLIARRIIFTKKIGDSVARGERIGLIKFGSRCDVICSADSELRVKVGDKVAGGSSVLAVTKIESPTTVMERIIPGSEKV